MADINAALHLARHLDAGPVVLLGSLFWAMLALEAAPRLALAGVIAYALASMSPATEVGLAKLPCGDGGPTYLIAGTGEDAMVELVASGIQSLSVTRYRSAGRHGASMLDEDPAAMADLLATLDRWFPAVSHSPSGSSCLMTPAGPTGFRPPTTTPRPSRSWPTRDAAVDAANVPGPCRACFASRPGP